MEGTNDNRGVNYRALSSLFKYAEESVETSYEFRMSCLEIYNENVIDLCRPTNSETVENLEIRMGKNNELFVPGLNEVALHSVEDAEKVLAKARSCRKTANNNVNEHSSRSHSVVTLKVIGRNVEGKEVGNGRLHLVDLAGSERLSSTMVFGKRLDEAKHINQSLSSLGDVISALGSKRQHVPYRNSKLTYLLRVGEILSFILPFVCFYARRLNNFFCDATSCLQGFLESKCESRHVCEREPFERKRG